MGVAVAKDPRLARRHVFRRLAQGRNAGKMTPSRGLATRCGLNVSCGSAAAVPHLRKSVSFIPASRQSAGSIDHLFSARTGLK
jgi:hypothetical protein